MSIYWLEKKKGGGGRRGNKCVSATQGTPTGRRAVVVKAQQALSLIAYCRVTTAPRRPQFFRIQVTLRFSATLGPRETIQEEGPPTDRPTNRYGEGIPTDRPCNRYGGGTLWFDNSCICLRQAPAPPSLPYEEHDQWAAVGGDGGEAADQGRPGTAHRIISSSI